ncbi:MAG TPA: hypothetical protein VF772_27580, partial [Terriglobales bacterium]
SLAFAALWVSVATSDTDGFESPVKKKRATRVWTLADILAAWPDCATSSAFTYSNREAKVRRSKAKDLAPGRILWRVKIGLSNAIISASKIKAHH